MEKLNESVYINESNIIGHGNPISFKSLRKLDKISENNMCKITFMVYDKKDKKYKQGNGSGFLFKQNISNIKYYNRYFLMTNNHNLDSNYINNNNIIKINYKNEEKIISLKEKRIKYTNEILDYTIIEIFKNEFNLEEEYFEIDEYIMNNVNGYKNEDIYIVQYPDGNELCFAQGQIQSIDNYNIKHSASTHSGSAGSPILIKSNDEFKIIGIHKQGGKEGKSNLGSFMKNILNDINNINSEENNLNNYIICQYDIKKDKLNQSFQILNSYEEVKRKNPDDLIWKIKPYLVLLFLRKEIILIVYFPSLTNLYLWQKSILVSFKYNSQFSFISFSLFIPSKSSSSFFASS